MNAIPLRLEPGADLRAALEDIASKAGGSMFVVSAIGSLVDATLRFADEPAEATMEGPWELLTLAGSLSTNGGHLHMSVSDRNGRVLGGHVGYGNIVRTTIEALLVQLPDWSMTRELDQRTGFKELVVRPR